MSAPPIWTRTLPSEEELRRAPLKLLEACESDEEARYVFDRVPKCFWAYFLDLELEPFQEEFIVAAERCHRLLGEWPAQHGKSTNMSYAWPVWHIARNPNVRIMQTGKTAEEMDAYGLLERNTLEKNEKLRAWYGEFRDPTPSGRRIQPWGANGINVFQRQIADPHNTIEWFGSNTDGALGHRCDIIIIDDVVTPETAGTPERRRKLEYRMREQWETAPAYRWRIDYHAVNRYPVYSPITGKLMGYLQIPEDVYWPDYIEYQKIVVVGTVFHYQDLYHVLEKDPSYHFIRRDCFVIDPDGTRRVLWPSRYTVEEFEAMARSNLLSFNRRFRNICTSEEDLSFRESDVEAMHDPSRSTGHVKDNWRLIVTLDPASGNATTKSAYPSLLCGAYDPKDPPKARMRYLVDCYRKHSMGYHDMLSFVIHWHDIYEYEVLVIEVNAFGSWLMDEKEPKIQELRSRGVRIIPHQTSGRRKDPLWSVRSLETSLRDHLWSVPDKSDDDRNRWGDFFEQMAMHPQGYTDYPMCAFFFDLQVRGGNIDRAPLKPLGGPFYTKIHLSRRRAASENHNGEDEDEA